MRQLEHERGGIDRLVSNYALYQTRPRTGRPLRPAACAKRSPQLEIGYRIGRLLVIREVLRQAPAGLQRGDEVLRHRARDPCRRVRRSHARRAGDAVGSGHAGPRLRAGLHDHGRHVERDAQHPRRAGARSPPLVTNRGHSRCHDRALAEAAATGTGRSEARGGGGRRRSRPVTAPDNDIDHGLPASTSIADDDIGCRHAVRIDGDLDRRGTGRRTEFGRTGGRQGRRRRRSCANNFCTATWPAHPELDDAVLAAIRDEVRPYVERIIGARQFGQASPSGQPEHQPSARSDLPAWTVVEPLPADELLAHYRDAEAATGIGWYWLAAIHLQETRMGRIIGTSLGRCRRPDAVPAEHLGSLLHR